jgi:hypothetical protein
MCFAWLKRVTLTQGRNSNRLPFVKSTLNQFMTFLLVMTLFIPTIMSSNAVACADEIGCSDISVVDSQISDLEDQSSNSSSDHHSNDCHCASHSHGCCNPTLVDPSQLSLLNSKNDSSARSNRLELPHKSPFLDGPFQPPKAHYT